MKPTIATIALGLAICVGLLLSVARAERGVVYFRDGTVMRGEVTESESEIVIENAAGRARFARSRIARIEYETRPGTQPASQPGAAPDAPPQSQPVEPTTTLPASQAVQLAPLPPLIESDILRLRLSELDLDAEPERLHVRFTRIPGKPTLEEVVLAELAAQDRLDPDSERILKRGKPNEKLQVILRHTGLKHADRIELKSEPQVFNTFRRRVLPHVFKGCVRSNCHAGAPEQAFRFPDGGRSTEGYAYSLFVLLDSIVTRDGPLIDREFPENSLLVHYLLPPDAAKFQHPAVEHARLPIVFGRRSDPRHQEMVDWIAALRIARPNVQLEFTPPDWLRALSQPDRGALPESEKPAPDAGAASGTP